MTGGGKKRARPKIYPPAYDFEGVPNCVEDLKGSTIVRVNDRQQVRNKIRHLRARRRDHSAAIWGPFHPFRANQQPQWHTAIAHIPRGRWRCVLVDRHRTGHPLTQYPIPPSSPSPHPSCPPHPPRRRTFQPPPVARFDGRALGAVQRGVAAADADGGGRREGLREAS